MTRACLPAAVAAVTAGLALAAPVPAGAASVPAFDHVVVIVMENRSYGDVMGNSAAPYLNTLAAQYASSAAYTAVTHPSLPNYLALTSGATWGISSDCTSCYLNVPSVADTIEASGRSWKAYMESMPSPCFAGSSYPYVQKHDPFIYYDPIRGSASRCSRIVPYSQLAHDLASSSALPSYSFVVPNLCDDMHDCSTATGDGWLRSQVPAILSSPAFAEQSSLLVITWDEDDYLGSNQVPAIVAGPSVVKGYVSGQPASHYALLHTLEAAWALPPLTGNDGAAPVMSDMFTATPTPTATQRYVGHVYPDLLGRPADPLGLAFWASHVDGGQSSPMGLGLAFQRSQEGLDNGVTPLYQLLLHRTADPSGLQAWTAAVAGGTTYEQARAAFAGSDEYYSTRAGSSPSAWLSAVYGDVLHRQPDPSGQAAWMQALQSGASRTSVAYAIVTGTESYDDLVAGWYQQLLRRQGDSSGISWFASELAGGWRDETAISQFIASAEYYAYAQTH